MQEPDRRLAVKAVRLPEHLQALLPKPESSFQTLLGGELAGLLPEAVSKVVRDGMHGQSIEQGDRAASYRTSSIPCSSAAQRQTQTVPDEPGQ